jgi:DNA modification methylase
LRNYETEGQIGLENTPQEYIKKLVDVFREVKRVLKNDGTLFIVIGDSYAGSGKGEGNGSLNGIHSRLGDISNKDRDKVNVTRKTFDKIKPKDLIGIPWMLAFALRDDGWWLRQDIVWAKKNPMPESVTDRCTKSHEYIFLLSKSAKYYFDNKAIQEPLLYPGDLGLLRSQTNTNDTHVAWSKNVAKKTSVGRC